MFSFCYSLTSLPDITKWDTTNNKNLNRIFYECNSLCSLPNICKWKNNDKIKYIDEITSRSLSLISIEGIPQWICDIRIKNKI